MIADHSIADCGLRICRTVCRIANANENV
jgi:hypothetical protein